MLNVLQNHMHLHFLVQNLGIAMDYMCALRRKTRQHFGLFFWHGPTSWAAIGSKKNTRTSREWQAFILQTKEQNAWISFGILWKQYEEVQIFQLNLRVSYHCHFNFVKSPSSFPFQGVKQFRQNDCLNRSNMLTLEQYLEYIVVVWFYKMDNPYLPTRLHDSLWPDGQNPLR